MRWIILVTLLVGCGGEVTPSVDSNGCPATPADWMGTATLSSGCAGAPATLQVNGGHGLDNANGGGPVISFGGIDSTNHMCLAIVGAKVSCGMASYTLKVPQN